jgi:hypothetical protein
VKKASKYSPVFYPPPTFFLSGAIREISLQMGFLFDQIPLGFEGMGYNDRSASSARRRQHQALASIRQRIRRRDANLFQC